MEKLIDIFKENKLFIVTFGVVASSILILKRKNLRRTHLVSNILTAEQIVIITGANCGIGYETACDLANRGATIVLACRDVEKAHLAAQSIRAKSNNQNVVVEYLDLASLDSVKKFAVNFLKKYERLDVLINNAGNLIGIGNSYIKFINIFQLIGVMCCPFQKTVDGLEYQFQVNYLSHYLLTRLLLDRIIQSAPSRIINVTSKLYESKNNSIKFKLKM
jgi:NAD(P)-dependent dehydrogenase (short-subunit alcohol dehydrogenase family)